MTHISSSGASTSASRGRLARHPGNAAVRPRGETAETPAEFAVEPLSVVLDRRWEDQRSLVFVTEQSPEKLETALGRDGPCVVSRIRGMCGPPIVIALDAPPEGAGGGVTAASAI